MYLVNYYGRKLKLSGQLAGIEAVPTPQKGEGGRTGNHESSRLFKEKLLGGTGCKPPKNMMSYMLSYVKAWPESVKSCDNCPFPDCICDDPDKWYGYRA